MNKILLVIDVQKDFCKGGALEVAGAEDIIQPVNVLMYEDYVAVIATQDWHPDHHMSFAVNNNKNVFETIETKDGVQVMWPKHCVQGTNGADFHENLIKEKFDMIIRKGKHASVDSYSAVYDNDHATSTPLLPYLERLTDFNRTEEAYTVDIVGLATDYCVKFTALDVKKLGFKTRVLLKACRGVAPETTKIAIKEMEAVGVEVIK